ncbi:MAG: ABC transporter ATP-binding protein [Wenzhouxiangella sp.]
MGLFPDQTLLRSAAEALQGLSTRANRYMRNSSSNTQPGLFARLVDPAKTIRRVLPILWQSARSWTIIAMALLLLEIVFGLLTLYLIKSLVDAITGLLGAEGGAVDLQSVLLRVAAFGAATLAFLATRSLSGLAREVQGMAVADHVDRLIHSRAVTADLAFYESPRYFDTLQRAKQSGSQRPAQVTSNILMLGKNLIMLAAITALLVSINALLLPILLIAIIPALLVRMHFTRVLYEWRRERTPLERRAGYLDWLMTSDYHAKELRLNQLGGYLRDLYSGIRTRIRAENFRISKRRTLVELAVATVATAVFFAALAYLAIQTAEGNNSVGDLVLFLLIFQRAQSMGQEIVGQISRFYEDHLYIGLLFEFLEVRPQITSPQSPQPVPEANSPRVQLTNVSFTYPGCSTPVLKDLNLEIRPGQVVALVGANGSGKTSLIKLLTRLYDPTSGQVLVDGKDARDYDLEEYRQLYSVIFQDYSRYADTLKQNVRYGRIHEAVDEGALWKAMECTGVVDFLPSLKHSMDTMLSRMFDEGQEISVGQWQKIALARAFYADSRIMILDEPSSALDPDAEFELFENFKARLNGRSALMISHRLSTIRLADYIYVLKKGRIVEVGQHEELMALGQEYYRSFSRQGKYYRGLAGVGNLGG